MKLRHGTCERCGADFVDRSAAQKRRFCSDNCRKRACEETTGRGSCVDCGGLLTSGSARKGIARCRPCHHARERERTERRAVLLHELWDAGLTLREIGERIGWSRIRAAAEIHRLREKGHHFESRPHCGLAALVTFDIEWAAAKYRAGWTVQRLADDVGCSYETMRRRLKAHGVELRRGRRARKVAA